eukprot:8603158-Alexandrium_andersonii.AAC.1
MCIRDSVGPVRTRPGGLASEGCPARPKPQSPPRRLPQPGLVPGGVPHGNWWPLPTRMGQR